jgi:trans-aconitate methyltransferase
VSTAGATHWDDRYRTTGAESVSWFEAEPTTSIDLLEVVGATPADAVIDVGGGASRLVDGLLAAGYQDVTVLDLSKTALDLARQRVGASAPVTWVSADVLDWRPARQYDIWHDRAVLHFLTDDRDRAEYLDTLHGTVRPGGAVIIGVFAEDGPTHCSGLPVRQYAPAELRELMPDLVFVDARRHEHRTPHGAVQPFNWIAGRIPG